MGHRALVVVERDDGRFDCHRTRRGALGAVEDPETVVAEAVDAGRPLATGVAVSRVLDFLDPRSDEAAVVRSGDGTAFYLVRWLGIPAAATDVDGPSVLVPVGDAGAVDRLDCTLRTAKGVLGDAADAGLVPGWMAVRYLAVAVARHPDVPPGSVWLPSGLGGV